VPNLWGGHVRRERVRAHIRGYLQGRYLHLPY
jgi:hypothetical protein